MSTLSVPERVRALQRRLGLRPDGLVGPVTLTHLERVLARCLPPPADANADAPPLPDANLVASKRGLDLIVAHEIGSEANYRRRLEHPVWPGGQSGVTIGIGYDLGHNTAAQVEKDWRGHLPDADLALLRGVVGLKGEAARQAARGAAAEVSVSLEAAREVFYTSTLPRFAALTRRTYPGVEALPADAQAALLSLLYNRGASLSGARRKEMLAIRDLVPRGDLTGIAKQIRAMKRLWEGAGLPGLLRRRDEEAQLVEDADRRYEADELVRL